MGGTGFRQNAISCEVVGADQTKTVNWNRGEDRVKNYLGSKIGRFDNYWIWMVMPLNLFLHFTPCHLQSIPPTADIVLFKEGLSWWSRGCEYALQCSGHWSHPWPGTILHAMEQSSPCATTTEPTHPTACALQREKPPQWEPGHWDEEQSLLSTTRETPCTATKTQCSQK